MSSDSSIKPTPAVHSCIQHPEQSSTQRTDLNEKTQSIDKVAVSVLDASSTPNQGQSQSANSSAINVKHANLPKDREEFFLGVASAIQKDKTEFLIDRLQRIPPDKTDIFIEPIEKLKGITLFIITMFSRKKELTQAVFARLKDNDLVSKMIPQRMTAAGQLSIMRLFLTKTFIKILKNYRKPLF